MFICSMVDYGIHTYIEAVRYIFISKICFGVLMVQIADSCCEVKIAFHMCIFASKCDEMCFCSFLARESFT